MSAKQSAEMIIMSPDCGKQPQKDGPSDKPTQNEDHTLTDLSLVLLDHGIPAAEVRNAVSRLATLRAAWQGGEISEVQMDHMAEVVMMGLFSRKRLRRAA